MPAHTSRANARLPVAMLLAVLLGGCAGEDGASNAASQATTSGTVAATTTTVPPMTAEELAWLKAVTKLRTSMEKAFYSTTSVYLTRAKMTSYARTLRGCGRELARIGSPSDRLEPANAIVEKACRTFGKGAKCYDTAARVSMADGGVVAGTPAERTQRKALDCGGASRPSSVCVIGPRYSA